MAERTIIECTVGNLDVLCDVVTVIVLLTVDEAVVHTVAVVHTEVHEHTVVKYNLVDDLLGCTLSTEESALCTLESTVVALNTFILEGQCAREVVGPVVGCNSTYTGLHITEIDCLGNREVYVAEHASLNKDGHGKLSGLSYLTKVPVTYLSSITVNHDTAHVNLGTSFTGCDVGGVGAESKALVKIGTLAQIVSLATLEHKGSTFSQSVVRDVIGKYSVKTTCLEFLLGCEIELLELHVRAGVFRINPNGSSDFVWDENRSTGITLCTH